MRNHTLLILFAAVISLLSISCSSSSEFFRDKKLVLSGKTALHIRQKSDLEYPRKMYKTDFLSGFVIDYLGCLELSANEKKYATTFSEIADAVTKGGFDLYNDNFLAVSMKLPGLFDDKAWHKFDENAASISEFCKKNHFRGVFLELKNIRNAFTHDYSEQETGRPFSYFESQAKKRGRELMCSFSKEKKDLLLVANLGYGMVLTELAGRDCNELPKIDMGLLPAFIDGLREGCGEAGGRILATGKHFKEDMNYRQFKGFVKWEKYAEKFLSALPDESSKNNYETALVFRSREGQGGCSARESMKNALAATPCYVFYLSEIYSPSLLKDILPDSSAQKSFCPADTENEFKIMKSSPPSLRIPTGCREVYGFGKKWLFLQTFSFNPERYSFGGLSPALYGTVMERCLGFRELPDDTALEFPLKKEGTGVFRTSFLISQEAKKRKIYLLFNNNPSSPEKICCFIATYGKIPCKMFVIFPRKNNTINVTEAIDFQGINYLTLLVTDNDGKVSFDTEDFVKLLYRK